MTAAARMVLADCRIALHLLEEETVLARWRVQWVAAITLIRAVGHVLDKIDGKNSKLKAITKDLFQTWKTDNENNSIFTNFINQERNNILKEYNFSLHPMDNVPVVLSSRLEDSSGNITNISEVFNIGENIYRPIIGGFRDGDDARDVYLDAINWWEVQLNMVDEIFSRK